jgi:hypothetical protein
VSGTPKVGRLSPPPTRIFGTRLGFGRYALWTCAELATTTDGTRYLGWLTSMRWLRKRPLYSEVRAALIGALQAEAFVDAPLPEGFV